MNSRRHLFAATLVVASWFAQANAATLPALSGRNEHGAAIDLAAYKGQVVMLYFWSTECAVCLSQLPEIRRNLNGWHGKAFRIVAVNQDGAISNLQAYEQVLNRVAPPDPQMEIVWRHDSAYHDSFGDLPVKAPTTLVIDTEGALVKRVSGRAAPEVWDDIADLVLNCAKCQ